MNGIDTSGRGLSLWLSLWLWLCCSCRHRFLDSNTKSIQSFANLVVILFSFNMYFELICFNSDSIDIVTVSLTVSLTVLLTDPLIVSLTHGLVSQGVCACVYVCMCHCLSLPLWCRIMPFPQGNKITLTTRKYFLHEKQNEQNSEQHNTTQKWCNVPDREQSVVRVSEWVSEWVRCQNEERNEGEA